MNISFIYSICIGCTRDFPSNPKLNASFVESSQANSSFTSNSGNHCNPTYAGDTIYAYSEILEKIEHKREDIGLLRVRTIALKNQNPKEIENAKGEDGKYLPNVVLDLDYTVVIPKKSTKK